MCGAAINIKHILCMSFPCIFSVCHIVGACHFPVSQNASLSVILLGQFSEHVKGYSTYRGNTGHVLYVRDQTYTQPASALNGDGVISMLYGMDTGNNVCVCRFGTNSTWS